MGSVLVQAAVQPSSGKPATSLRRPKSQQQLALPAAAEPSGAAQEPAPAATDPPNKVCSSLFIGSRDTEADCKALEAAGITHVLQVGVELLPSHTKFKYLQLACSDTESQDMVGLFKEAFAFVDEGRATGAVLVHCAQGVSRSATVVLGYLMTRLHLGFDAALRELQAARPIAQPNNGFVLQLQDFGRRGCSLAAWLPWSEARLAACFAASSRSGRREVNSLSAMIRQFHMSDVGEEDTVLDCRSFLL